MLTRFELGFERTVAMTLPNTLSISRLPLALVLASAIWLAAWWVGVLAFYLAVASDLLDGIIARRQNQSSDLGTKLDHTADAVFVFCGLLALGVSSTITLLLCAVQLTSFVLYLAESIGASSALRASALGKANGVAYFFVIGIPVTQGALGVDWVDPLVVQVLAWALVLTSLISIVQRYVTRIRPH